MKKIKLMLIPCLMLMWGVTMAQNSEQGKKSTNQAKPELKQSASGKSATASSVKPASSITSVKPISKGNNVITSRQTSQKK